MAVYGLFGTFLVATGKIHQHNQTQFGAEWTEKVTESSTTSGKGSSAAAGAKKEELTFDGMLEAEWYPVLDEILYAGAN